METESRDGREALRKPDAEYRSDPLTDGTVEPNHVSVSEQGQY